jgi:hypothetical protein
MLLFTSPSNSRITVGSKSFQTLENTAIFGSKTVTGDLMRSVRATTKAQSEQGCNLKFLKMLNPVDSVKIYSLKLNKSVDMCPMLTFNLPKTTSIACEFLRKGNYLLDKIKKCEKNIEKIPYMIVLFRFICVNLWYTCADDDFNDTLRNKLLHFSKFTGNHHKLLNLVSYTFLHHIYPEELN